ncbi:MAG: fumarylacetoacetate hydrolase family protein [Pseudomonadota bacterium]
MKVVSFLKDGRASYGLVVANGVIDAGKRLGLTIPDLKTLLERDALVELHALAAETDADFALSDIRFLPPIPKPDKILCVGLNYRPHIEETGFKAPKYPLIFTRFASSQVGHGEALTRPSVSDKLDYEGELAVVIGRRGRHIPAAGALRHVAGYACFNDGSVRDYQRHGGQFTPGKNFVGSGAFGPWLTTAEEVSDPAELGLKTRLNGQEVQSASVSELIFSVPELISYCSGFTELVPGDVIVTGTPGGVGYAQDPPRYLTAGDTIEVAIEGLGVLRNSVVDEADTLARRAQIDWTDS